MIVGLGNPGAEYIETRHNAGFRVIDSVAEALGIEVRKSKFGGRLGECGFADNKLILLKPMQYMNCSGHVVATAFNFYKLSLDNLLVVSDEMALEPGRIRLRAKGTGGGHNGLADIIDKLGTMDFARLRIGIGSSGRQLSEDYVLSVPQAGERPLLEEAFEQAKQAVLCWAEHGLKIAMNKFNN